VADKSAVIVPVVVIVPPVTLINSDDAVAIDVTVPILRAASIVFTTSLTLKLRVTFSASVLSGDHCIVLIK
jgi:hypothetical protein